MWERSCIVYKGGDCNIKLKREGEDASKHSAPPPLQPSQPRTLLSRLKLFILSPPSFAVTFSTEWC